MSLHWILMLTMTLMHCLTANPIHKEIKTMIKELKKAGCSETDSTFYCPSGTGETKCTGNALDCSIQELDKVQTECFEENIRNKQLVNRVKSRIVQSLKNTNISLPGNFKNCFCGDETLEEKPFNEFLDNILRLLQMLNSI